MTHSPERPRVVFVDDGELGDVRALLDSLGVGYGEVRTHEDLGGTDGCDLLISSARHALATPFRAATAPPLPCRLHLVVYDAISEGLRRILSRSGCDVAIGRPVHPAVLRLLVAHACYAGPERRERGRVAMSVPVRLSNPPRNSVATLVDLSGRGCGLIATERVEVGDRVEVILPPEFTAGGSLCLPASVIDAQPSAEGRAHRLALVFEAIDADVATALDEVMVQHSLGVTPNRDVAQSRAAGEAECPPEPSRSGPRKLFAGRVIAAGSGEPRMMIGRDLSAGGMRVRPVPGLRVGDSLKVALYGGDAATPIVIEAAVARDDGWDGLALRFLRVAPEVRSRLEALVESLPATRSPQVATSRTPGVLVSEILGAG
jgi:hypothetical protein